MPKHQFALSFLSDTDFPYDKSIEAHLKMHFEVDWVDFTNKYPTLSLSPSISALTVSEVKITQKNVDGRVKDPVNVLKLYLVNIDSENPVEDIITDCQNLPFVESVEHMSPLSEEDRSTSQKDRTYIASSDPLFKDQFYFHDDFRGTYLESAWNEPGADSQYRRMFVISDSYNDTHPDLRTPTIRTIGVNPYKRGDYKGSELLSITSSRKDGIGLVGAGYNLRNTFFVSYYDAHRSFNLIEAIELVVYNAFHGDVLLLPETLAEQNGFKNVPLEANPIYRSLLRRATAKGLVVVVAAGDENFNLDTYQDTNGKYIFDMLNRGDFEPTGTVMVGNATTPSFGNQLEKSTWSNYGSRVTMHAVGTEVIAAKADWQSASGPYRLRTGTHVATAIIAGTLRAMQSGFEYNFGHSMTGEQLAFTVGNFAGKYVQNLGHKPNAYQFLQKTPKESLDVFLRDYITDYGDRHEYPTVSSSPDIVVRQRPYVQPNAEIGEGSQHRNTPHLSQPIGTNNYHYVYLRAQNRSRRNSGAVEINMYYSPPSTIAIPSRWIPLKIEQKDWHFPNIPPGRKLTVSPVAKWDTSGIKPGHYCFIAGIYHLLDPRPNPRDEITDVASYANFIRKYNNWAWRNFNVVSNVPLAGSGLEYNSAEGDIVSFPGEKMSLDLESNLPDDAQLTLRVPLSFEKLMQVSGKPDPQDPNYVLIDIDTQQMNTQLVEEMVIPELTSFELRYYVPRDYRENRYTVSFVQTFMGLELGRLTYLIMHNNEDDRDYDRYRF